MGKRRLKDRVREAGEAFEQARDSAVDAQLEAARPDEDLFFVDTEARCMGVGVWWVCVWVGWGCEGCVSGWGGVGVVWG